MLSFEYTYLLMGLFFFVIWLAFFIKRKDVRKEMLIMSLIFGIAGPLLDVVYYKDWWTPLTLNNSVISFEAFLVGFSLGGVVSVAYEEIFKNKLIEKRKYLGSSKNNSGLILIIFLLLGGIFFGFHFLFGINSFMSTIVAFTFPTIIIWFKRRDLIFMSVASGFLTLVVAAAVYNMLELLTPGWINVFWQFKNVPGLIIFNMPIDDIVWYFLAGCFISLLYPFWHEGKLVKI